MAGSLRALAELVLPRTCAGCGAHGTWWCDACAQAIDAEPQRVDAAAVPCWSAAPYRGPAGQALVAMKERGAVAAQRPLAHALSRAVVAALAGRSLDRTPVVLVPAPSRRSVVRSRGADVVLELARATATLLRSEGPCEVVVVPCLTHARRVLDQSGLGPAERAENLAGALRARELARPLLTARTVIVVDDVITTGATLREAARALRVLDPNCALLGATIASTGWVRGAPDRADSAGRLVRVAPDG